MWFFWSSIAYIIQSILGLKNEMKQKVMMLHIDFFGGIDFSTRDFEGNKLLVESLAKKYRDFIR